MRQLTVSCVGILMIAITGCYQRTNAPILPAVDPDVKAYRQDMGMDSEESSDTPVPDGPSGVISGEGEGD